jgi:hypothetical protein
MPHALIRAASWTLGVIGPLLVCAGVSLAADDKSKKASLSLKVTPSMAAAPARVRASVEIKGGANDNPELYCPQIEWNWGDDTTSESAADCEPYEAGRSTIQRRYSAEHTYRYSGLYKLTLRLKQKDRVVAFTSTNLQIQSGLGEQ